MIYLDSKLIYALLLNILSDEVKQLTNATNIYSRRTGAVVNLESTMMDKIRFYHVIEKDI